MAAPETNTVLRYIRNLAGRLGESQQTDSELLRAFLDQNDQSAFEAILRRHGSLVLRICRRVLDDPHDAEDAFQATFMLLAQKAVSIRKKDSLASWLHGVAYRMATNARRAASRRRRHEREVGPVVPPNPAWQAAWREVQSILDEELQALPEAYREPLIRCSLEHKGCAEVARELRLEERTVRQRLSRGRKLLEKRLARRGVSLAAVLTAITASESCTLAAPGMALLCSTAKLAAQVALGQVPTANLASAKVVALVKGVNQTMVLTKVKTAVLSLLCAVSVTGGFGLAAFCGTGTDGQPPAQKVPHKKAQAPVSAPCPAQDRTTERPQSALAADVPPAAAVERKEPTPGPGYLIGRVLGPDGQPIAGARVWCTDVDAKPIAETRTDGTGRYRLGPFAASIRRREDLLVEAPGLARQYLAAPSVFPDHNRDLGETTLTRGQRVRGQLLDVDGRPKAGTTIEVMLHRYTLGHTMTHIGEPYRIPTDEQGKFESPPLPICGGYIVVRAPECVTISEALNLRPGKDQELTLRLRPDKPFVVQVVTEDGHPVAGARLVRFWLHNNLVSDAQGRIEIRGLDKPPGVLLGLQTKGYPEHELIIVNESTKVVLKKPVYLCGKAVDADTGAPVKLSRIVICQLRRTSEGKLEPFG